MGPVQRYPAGLLELLNLKGISPPRELADYFQGSIDLLQFFGQSQLQNNAVTSGGIAEGSNVTMVPDARSWILLYAAAVTITKTATMTALRAAISLQRAGALFPTILAQDNLGPFGATETGNASVPWWAPYPVLCPPGTVLLANPVILGTDATCNVTVRAEWAVLS